MDLHFSARPPSQSLDHHRQPPESEAASSSRRSSNAPHVLPPLQAQQTNMPQPMYNYAPNASHAARSYDPSSAMPMPPSSHLPHLAPQPSLAGMQHQHPSYNNHSFAPSTSMISPSANAMPNHHPVSSAPNGRLPVPLRPMPSGGMDPSAHQDMQPAYGNAQMLSSEMQGQDQHPTHVVGSQGRRGILPSAPGRAAAVGGNASSAKNITPVKDSDGKFPCPHCNKTYLHAKHLKRHLLRHTGDRPYMCFLCKDTFSRSDILKRHFQKCSLRRGNPTGASHLAHSQAHIKKPPPIASQRSEGSGLQGQDFSSLNYIDGLDESHLNTQYGGATASHTRAPQNHSNESSRPSSGEDRDGQGMSSFMSNRTGLHAGPDRDAGISLAPAFDSIGGSSMPEPHARHPSRYSHHFDFDHRDSLPGHGLDGAGRDADHTFDYYNGVQAGNSQHLDWSNMIPGPSEHMIHPMFPPDGGHTHHEHKLGSSLDGASFDSSVGADQDGVFNSLYPTPSRLGGEAVSNMVSDLPNWQLDFSQLDPLHNKAIRLVAFCFSQEQSNDEELKSCLTPENIKHFIELFTNFQGHWPIIHVPTFNFTEAYDGLVMAMACIGAVYSDRVSVNHVRALMERVRVGIERTSQLLGQVKRERSGQHRSTSYSSLESHTQVEELQALFLIQMLFTWHGSTEQRSYVRHAFVDTVNMVRKAGLLEPRRPDHATYSVLHQPNTHFGQHEFSSWDWRRWVEQEKRIRVMYNIYLLDTAFVIYFNTTPRIDSFDVHIPLPADDAAWDAKNASACADALGLNGPDVQQRVNVSGSRRIRQPEMHLALKALLQPGRDFQKASTNLYAKFILIHALHIQIWRAQRYLSQNPNEPSFGGSAPSTPGLQHDWMSRSFDNRSNYSGNTNSSGYVTPTEGIVPPPSGPQQLLTATKEALNKWKRVWDEDWITQYPLTGSTGRRFGFCRDGVHFYWLAQCFIQRKRPLDCFTAPDTRMVQVLRLLKQVQQWVARDTATRGEDIGSVGDIDVTYGMENLTLDMKLLFKPINDDVDSPVSGVQTNVSNRMV